MFAVMLVKIARGWVSTRPCSIGASLIHFPLSRFDLLQDDTDFFVFFEFLQTLFHVVTAGNFGFGLAEGLRARDFVFHAIKSGSFGSLDGRSVCVARFAELTRATLLGEQK